MSYCMASIRSPICWNRAQCRTIGPNIVYRQVTWHWQWSSVRKRTRDNVYNAIFAPVQTECRQTDRRTERNWGMWAHRAMCTGGPKSPMVHVAKIAGEIIVWRCLQLTTLNACRFPDIVQIWAELKVDWEDGAESSWVLSAVNLLTLRILLMSGIS